MKNFWLLCMLNKDMNYFKYTINYDMVWYRQLSYSNSLRFQSVGKGKFQSVRKGGAV